MEATSPATQVLYDSEIQTREDLDGMEEAIRNVRVTMSSTSDRLASGTRRCNILDTAAYMAMRLTLLRWVSAYGNEEPRLEKTCMCHIGSGILLRATWPEGVGAIANVCIVWRHSDILPVVTSSKTQPRGLDDDDDDDFSRSSKRPSTGKKKNS